MTSLDYSRSEDIHERPTSPPLLSTSWVSRRRVGRDLPPLTIERDTEKSHGIPRVVTLRPVSTFCSCLKGTVSYKVEHLCDCTIVTLLD